MIRRLCASFLIIVALVSIVEVCQAQPQSLLTLHVREVVVTGQAPVVGTLPAAQSMRFDIVLPLRDRAGLQDFLQELYDPTSLFYHRFLAPEEFTSRFGPSQTDWDALVAFAKASGFDVVSGSRDAMDLRLTGSVASIEQAFHVTLGIYQHPTENRTFYAPDREPTVDLPFQLWHISGLDNYSIPRPALVGKDANSDLNIKSNATTGSGPSASFLGSDMRAAYYGGSLTGSGQSLGLLEYYGTDLSDLNTYFENTGQTNNVPITLDSTDGTSTSCVHPGCDDLEQTLDMTQAIGMAPGLSSLVMYVGSTDTALLGAMSSDTPLSLQLSSSWLWSPSDPSTDDPYLERMAAQGQSFFQAAGDRGAFNSNYPSWPADSAYVTSVGGTVLTTQGPGGPWNSETAWSDGGGGYWSPDRISIPAWQQLNGVITQSNEGSTVYRNAPDVSANAAVTFYVCANQTTCSANHYGGTSFAAPMWAGYLALANQQAASHGGLAPGFINPAIYQLGLGADYGISFHDITIGSNGYPAVTGYDLATGWGSPNRSVLINALTGISTALTTTTVVSSANPAAAGEPITFTSTVTSQDGPTPMGTVTFKNGAALLGAAVLVNGQANFQHAFPGDGNYSITAIYIGDANNAGSTAPILIQYVKTLPVATTTTLTTSASPVYIGQPVTFTATVSSKYGTVPNGELVTFYDGATVIGTGMTASSMASLTTSALSAKKHTIKATYAGDSTYKTSTSSVTEVVNLYSTTTALSVNPNPSSYGQAVVLTAQVIGTGSAAPTGTVTFKNGSTGLGTVTLTAGGVASLSKTNLPVGMDDLTATYNGDTVNGKSISSPLTQNVNPAQITLTLTSSPNPSNLNQSVKFTATLTSSGSLPTGTVTFSYDSTTLGTATIAGGKASLSTRALPTGTDLVTATFAGTNDYSGASGNVTQNVN